MVLPTKLPKPAFTPRPSTLSAAPSRRQSAPDDDIAEVDAPSPKRVKTDGMAVGNPSKRERLEEEGLVLLESATDGMEDGDVIDIDGALWCAVPVFYHHWCLFS